METQENLELPCWIRESRGQVIMEQKVIGSHPCVQVQGVIEFMMGCECWTLIEVFVVKT